MTRSRDWGLVAVGTVSYTCLTFIWFSLAAFLTPLTAEVGLTGTQAGILVGTVPLTYIPLALVTGLAVDRFGPGRTIGVGVLAYGTGQLGRSAVASFPSLFACTVLIGVGATTITFGLPKLVAIRFAPDRTGAPSSLYLLGASAGTASVFAVGRPLLGPWLGGWRGVFFWSGLVASAYGLCWLGLVLVLGVDDAVGNDDPTAAGAMLDDLRAVLTHRELQLIVVIGTMYLLLAHGLQGWLPTLLESRGVSADRAGRVTSLLVVALATGTLSIPVVADRFRARRGALIACGGVVTAGVGLLIATDVGWPVLAAVLVAGIGIGGISPLLRAIPPALEGLGTRLTGTAVAFIFAVGEIGGFLGPFIIGSLRDITGSFLPGLGVLAAGGVVIVLAASRLAEL